MENIDVMVLRTLRDWRIQSKRALLATVVRTWGSSPRPVGSIMALCEDGQVVGSVSGGCIEDDLIYQFTQAYSQPTADSDQAPKHIPSGPPSFIKYGISADEAHRFGLPCGGTLELLLEFDPDAASLADLVTALAISAPITLLLGLKWRDLMLHAFDPAQAKVSGLKVGVLHYGLLAILALTIVATLSSIGLILAIGLLIAPGAIAFLVARRFGVMLVVATGVTTLAMLIGLWAAFYLDSAPAPTIILVLTGFFLVAFAAQPLRRALRRALHRADRTAKVATER